MMNTNIFEEYDMVVCMTQKTINDQLMHLTKMGIIKPELCIEQTVSGRDYVYKVLGSASELQRDGQGNPVWAYIDGIMVPQVNITESGSNITFILQFMSGTAAFWEGSGPMAQLATYDMKNWTYGISITLDLKSVEKDDIGNKIKVPDLVKEQLDHFTSSMFSVNHLFMDFESTDLMRFDPAHTDAKSAGETGMSQLVTFMNFYLTNLQKDGNPFILGYSLTTTDRTNYDPDQNVPDPLRPVGTTFSLYHDPLHPDLSNLNFVLATKGGHGSITGTPGNFDSNWISPTDQCDAKMIYSHTCFSESLLIKPLFEQTRTQVFNAISGNIDVGEGNDYDAAKSETSTGYGFIVSDVNSGDNQYVNKMSATFSSDATSASIAMNGHLAFYKEVHKNMGFCTAEADASGSLDWSTGFNLTTGKDADGKPALQIQRTPVRIGNNKSDSSKNDCAKGFSVIGDILGKILDGIAFFDNKFFSNLFDGLMGTPIPGIGNVGVAVGNIGQAINTVVILPGGQVFFIKSPSIDSQGNVALQLTYKAEN